MIKLMNSAIMPRSGDFYNREIGLEQFAEEVRVADETDTLDSYIGYQTTADIIEEISGVKVGISRAQTKVEHGDVLLIIKLKYRLGDPKLKGITQPTIDDFEFFRCGFRLAGR